MSGSPSRQIDSTYHVVRHQTSPKTSGCSESPSPQSSFFVVVKNREHKGSLSTLDKCVPKVLGHYYVAKNVGLDWINGVRDENVTVNHVATHLALFAHLIPHTQVC